MCPCLCVCPVLSPWSWSRFHDHAADAETGLKVASVLNSEALVFLAAQNQWTKVDVTCRCDLTPKVTIYIF